MPAHVPDVCRSEDLRGTTADADPMPAACTWKLEYIPGDGGLVDLFHDEC